MKTKKFYQVFEFLSLIIFSNFVPTNSLDPCESYPCQRGGICIKLNEYDFKCVCDERISTGTYCENFNPCWRFPCQRGGQCITKGSSYSCLCKENTYGTNCEYYKDANTGSTILTKTSLIGLAKLVGLSSMKLLYQASRDGFSASEFHSQVDGTSGTLLVAITTGMKIFGGYTEADWSGDQIWKSDPNAFLFSLVNELNMPVKMNIKFSNYAIYASPSTGPLFGYGNDLAISFDNKSSSIAYGVSNIGNSYQYPYFFTKETDASTFLGDSRKFEINDIEVYSVLLDSCLSSPCNNKGTCRPTSATNYVCECTDSFFGKNCDYRELNSKTFKHSTILTESESVQLLDQIELSYINKNWKLIYQASRDGFDEENFHRKCDYINNILLLVKTKNSDLLGGYTSIGWTFENEMVCLRDTKAFVFSFKNKYNVSFKSKVKNSNKAVCSCKNCSVSFGNMDLLIPITDKSLGSIYLGNDYEKPNNMDQLTAHFFSSGTIFFVHEIEAYTLAFNKKSTYSLKNKLN